MPPPDAPSTTRGSGSWPTRRQAVDRLPLMPITMMFAADLAGVPYRDYAADHRVLAEAQVGVAEAFGFDYVSAISDPAREAADLGGAVEWFDDQPPAIDREPGAAGRQVQARDPEAPTR